MIRTSFMITLLLSSATFAAAAEPDAVGFKPLFNGQDLTGWVLVNTPPSTWSVEEGMLVCSGKPIGEIRTEKMYQNFILELEWRHMKPRGNAGIFVWADDITARGVPFHRSIEVQVLENAYGNGRGHTTHGDIFPIHGARMTPLNGRNGSRAFPTENRSKASPEWNHYRITCEDGAISLAVNGKVVTRGKDCSLRKGYVCLESEGGIVHYRNVRIKELESSPLDESYVAKANRGFRSLYTGLDLSGWLVAEAAIDSWQAKDWILAYDGKADSTARINTLESFRPQGFIVDVRLRGESESITLSFGQYELIKIDPGNETVSRFLRKPGQWNRIEGTFSDEKLLLQVNENPVAEKAAISASGTFSIAPAGPVDLANIYVR